MTLRQLAQARPEPRRELLPVLRLSRDTGRESPITFLRRAVRLHSGLGEVKAVVIAAGGVKGGAAMRAAGVAIEILGDGESPAARSAKNRMLVPFRARPRFQRVAGESVVAILAGVEEAAAAHLDGDDVESGVVVGTARLRIELQAVDEGSHRGIRPKLGQRVLTSRVGTRR